MIKKKCIENSVEQQLFDVKTSIKSIEQGKEKARKNIPQMNIIDVMRRVPPLPKHRVQDTRNGHVIVLDEAGLEPTFVSKKVRIYYNFY